MGLTDLREHLKPALSSSGGHLVYGILQWCGCINSLPAIGGVFKFSASADEIGPADMLTWLIVHGVGRSQRLASNNFVKCVLQGTMPGSKVFGLCLFPAVYVQTL